jgi:hypothetical protein
VIDAVLAERDDVFDEMYSPTPSPHPTDGCSTSVADARLDPNARTKRSTSSPITSPSSGYGRASCWRKDGTASPPSGSFTRGAAAGVGAVVGAGVDAVVGRVRPIVTTTAATTTSRASRTRPKTWEPVQPVEGAAGDATARGGAWDGAAWGGACGRWRRGPGSRHTRTNGCGR